MAQIWHMREYKPSDETDIKKLYCLVFGVDLDADQWRWRYVNNPTGLVAITIAEAEEGIVGQYALLPVIAKVGDTVRTVALSLDTMVHPDYRGQGMFSKLAMDLYKRVERKGVPLIYGFPNEASHHGFVARLGWVDLCERVPLFIRPLDVKRILGTKVNNHLFLTVGEWIGLTGWSLLCPTRPSELPDGCTIQQVDSFDECVDQLWEHASSALNITVVRNYRYLNWRYVEKPGDEYTIFTLEGAGDILGYVVLKIVKKFGLQIGFVVDLLAVPDQPNISRYLISKAVEYFKELQADMISCMMLKQGPYIQALKKSGFLFVPPKFHPQEMYLGVRRNTKEYPAEFITNPNNWYVTWGDHDDV